MSNGSDPNTNDTLHDEIDVEEYARRHERLPRARQYIIRIDGERHRIPTATVTAEEILALAGLANSPNHTVEQVHGSKREVVCPCNRVDLTAAGVERFEIRAGVAVFIDEERVISPTATPTVRELIALCEDDPSKFVLAEKHGSEITKHTNLDDRLTVQVCDRFVIIHNTPTPVS